MNFKTSPAERTTVTRNTDEIEAVTGNIYESLKIISQRANQISKHMKEELNAKLAEFATNNDNLEEVFENREQIEISRFYERLPKPHSIAVDEFLTDQVYAKTIEKDNN